MNLKGQKKQAEIDFFSRNLKEFKILELLEIINRLNLIEKELLKKSAKAALEKYNVGEVIHQKQMQFHQCQKKNRWVFGGNRTGKTECGAVEVVFLARGNHPFKNLKKATSGWVVSLSRQVQRDVAQSKILYYLEPEWIVDVVMAEGKKSALSGGVIDYILIKNVFGTFSKIGFKSCDQGREKFQGTSLDYVWFDEEPPFDIYMECRMRVLDTSGEIFGTMTPLKGLTWVYNEIYLNESCDKEIWSITMTWEDNPFLNKNEVEKLSAVMSESELESRKFGRFMSFNGGVYPEFDVNVHVIEPFDVPFSWQDKISIDPGLNNPLSAHWYAVDFDGNVFVVAEHYEAKKDILYHSQKIKEISKRLNWKTKNGYIESLIDSAANQRTLASSKSVSELFYENGILVNTNVNKDVFTGIQRVKSYLKNALGKPKLFIFKSCVNMIREFKGYFWGNDDSPQKKDDHAMDELRYYITSKPENKPESVVKNSIQKDKERLIKKLKNNR